MRNRLKQKQIDALNNSHEESMVSYFENVLLRECRNIPIMEFINNVRSGKYQDQINEIRNENDIETQRKLKLKLPSITTSGTFKNSHSAKDLIHHSGFIQIDIDKLEEKLIRNEIEKEDFVFSCFTSPTGTGIKLIVKIDSNRHLDSFKSLQEYFIAKYKIEIDAKCKDVGRPMFVSYDEKLYLNKSSKLFEVKVENVLQLQTNENIFSYTEIDKENVESLICEIERRVIDITDKYDNWLKIGFALCSCFSEHGRKYFHRLSKFNKSYLETETDLQYDSCINSKGKGIYLGTLFHIAKERGIEIKNNAIKEKERIQESKEENYNKVEHVSQYAIVEAFLTDKYVFKFNEISYELLISKKGEDNFSELSEDNIYRELQKSNIRFSLANLSSLLRSDFVQKFNPFEDYFNSLPTYDLNTEEDYIEKFANYVQAIDQDRFNIQFKKMLVRTVACALMKDFFNKHAFILVQRKQNTGKTSLCRFLCPPALKNYITESISVDKDSLISLCENLFINIDELSVLSKFDLNALKSMFSKDKVKIRRPFERRVVTLPRRCSFIGSTNSKEFLNDVSGSVRWLCFEISEINWDYKLEIDINKVWGQAYALFLSDFKYELSSEEISENEVSNEKHQQQSPEKDLIQTWLIHSNEEEGCAKFYTCTDLITEIQNKGNYQGIKLNSNTFGKALVSMGFVQVQKSTGKYPRKGYYAIIRENQYE